MLHNFLHGISEFHAAICITSSNGMFGSFAMPSALSTKWRSSP
jgi:hypothetical protein